MNKFSRIYLKNVTFPVKIPQTLHHMFEGESIFVRKSRFTPVDTHKIIQGRGGASFCEGCEEWETLFMHDLYLRECSKNHA